MWPVVIAPLERIPIGAEDVATVALSNIWIMWWNSEQVIPLLGDYWNAPIYFPEPGGLALNEPQPTTLLVAPVIWLTGSRILAYNIYVWLSLVLNGVFAQRLARVYGMGPWPALWVGAAMVLLPMTHWQLGVSHLVPLWGFLWSWSAIERLCRKPSKWRAVELGVAVALSFITCMHQGLFFALLLLLAAPALWRHLGNYRELRYWAVSVILVLIIAGPFLLQVRHYSEKHAQGWDRKTVTDLSAKPGDYLQTYGEPLVAGKPQLIVDSILEGGPADRAGLQVGDRVLSANGKKLRSERHFTDMVRESENQELSLVVRREEASVELAVTPLRPTNVDRPPMIGVGFESPRLLSTGWLKFLLALVGVVYGLRLAGSRRWAAFLFTLAALAYFLSLGPNLSVFGWHPWWTLAEIVPGIERVRSVLRFAFFVQMAGVIFAALGLVGVYRLCGDRLKGPTLKLNLQRGVVVLAFVALLDARPPNMVSSIEAGSATTDPGVQSRFAQVVDIEEHRGWVDYVRENTPAGHGIACLPFPPTGRVEDYLRTSEWMYLGTFHGAPILNGYTTHFPEHYLSFRKEFLLGKFPNPEILRRLHDEKIKYVIAPRGDAPRNVTLGGFSLTRVCADKLVEVYELELSKG